MTTNTVKTDERSMVISYLTLRKTVGILGMSLPFILVIGCLFLDKNQGLLNSISSYYHTHMGNAFVGILCAFGLFLFSYRGHSKKDNLAGDLGCLFALGVAFFPNNINNPSEVTNILHLTSAALFFVVLIYFSLVLFTKSNQPTPYPPIKQKRNLIYRICGYSMIGCILTIAIYKSLIEHKYPAIDSIQPVFWLETLALIAFGISWFTKGQGILKDPN